MTKEELYNKHYDTLNTGGHAKISIEYAISVLESLKDKDWTIHPTDRVDYRLAELKSLLMKK